MVPGLALTQERLTPGERKPLQMRRQFTEHVVGQRGEQVYLAKKRDDLLMGGTVLLPLDDGGTAGDQFRHTLKLMGVLLEQV